MARLPLFLLNALFALLSVVQAKEEIIRLYTFTADSCYGPPQLGNVDLKRGQCQNIPAGARSLKPFIHKNTQWLHDINSGATHCEVIAYQGVGCIAEHELAYAELPDGIQECIHPRNPDVPFHSVKFDCGSKHEDPSNMTFTTTVVATSWGFGPDEKPTAYRSTETLTLTHFDNGRLAARSATPEADRLEPRNNMAKEVHKGVWMYHPWSRSVICYDCYTKDTNSNKFKCYSGPLNPINCGARQIDQDENPATVTTTATGTFTSYSVTFTPVTTYTLQGVTSISTGEGTDLEKRSWHRRVTFTHPWTSKKMCADAEWEKRGQEKSTVRLQKPGEDMKKCDKADQLQFLDLPAPISRTVMYPVTVLEPTTVAPTSTLYVLDDGDDDLTTVTSSSTSTLVTTQTLSETTVTRVLESATTTTYITTTYTPIIAHGDL